MCSYLLWLPRFERILALKYGQNSRRAPVHYSTVDHISVTVSIFRRFSYIVLANCCADEIKYVKMQMQPTGNLL